MKKASLFLLSTLFVLALLPQVGFAQEVEEYRLELKNIDAADSEVVSQDARQNLTLSLPAGTLGEGSTITYTVVVHSSGAGRSKMIFGGVREEPSSNSSK